MKIEVENNNLTSVSNRREYFQILLENVVELLLKTHSEIISIYLIGSYVDGLAKKGSDSDLVVILPKNFQPIDGIKKILCHITPIIFDVKFYNEVDIVSGKIIIDPCITFKNKLIFGKDRPDLFLYTLNQYNRLNKNKIENFILTTEKFYNVRSKQYYLIINRLLRYYLGVKYKQVTFTKEQSSIAFLERESSSTITMKVESLEREVMEKGYDGLEVNTDFLRTLYHWVNDSTGNLMRSL